MTPEQLIPVEVFCTNQEVETSFILSLYDRGLIQLTIVQEQRFIETVHLPRIEQLARMHYELDINLEGIEAISHILERMQHLQDDMRALRERLRIYEEG